MPRILCLHGHGTSSRIFESQLTGVRMLLPPQYELIFADGEVECKKAVGVPDHVPGPFLCYFKTIAFEDVQAAHELLEAIIEEDGPFDGVFGFSQGASIVLSLLLERERHRTTGPAPFKFALLFSPIVAFCPDPTYLEEEVDALTEDDFAVFENAVLEASGANASLQTGTAADSMAMAALAPPAQYLPSLADRKALLVKQVGGVVKAGLKTEFINADQFLSQVERRDKSSMPRPFHPAFLKERVKIPIVLVTGSKDDPVLQEQFKIIPLLCQPTVVKHVEFDGGHHLPREPSDIIRIVKQVKWAQEEGDMLAL